MRCERIVFTHKFCIQYIVIYIISDHVESYTRTQYNDIVVPIVYITYYIPTYEYNVR